MIVYKKAILRNDGLYPRSYVIVKMKVDGKLVIKTNSYDKKMRAKSVLVLSITSLDGKGTFDRACSAGWGGARGVRREHVSI